jgi:hypothetical protein
MSFTQSMNNLALNTEVMPAVGSCKVNGLLLPAASLVPLQAGTVPSSPALAVRAKPRRISADFTAIVISAKVSSYQLASCKQSVGAVWVSRESHAPVLHIRIS